MQAAAPVRKKRRLAHEINVVPYIDVMLVLLIIFMITAPLLTQGIEVDLPETSAESMSAGDEPATLTVDAKGRFFLDIGEASGSPVSDQELVRRAGMYVKRNPQKIILIRGDTAVDYGRVAHGMALLQQAGATKIGFVSDPLPPPKSEAAAGR